MAGSCGSHRGKSCASANGYEVLVSKIVKDTVSCSGVVFEDKGTHSLKGQRVNADWHSVIC